MCLDADRLGALKAMFFEVNKVNGTDAERILGYQMFQIAKRLTSSELLTLKAAYGSFRHGDFSRNVGMNPISAETWGRMIANEVGHQFVDMIVRDRRRLTDEGLLVPSTSPPTNSPLDIRYPAQNAGLSLLGIKFCEAIQNYQIEKDKK